MKRWVALILTVGTWTTTVAFAAPLYRFTNYDPFVIPNITVTDTNDLGQVVGYNYSTGTGYLLDPRTGTATTISVPSSIGYTTALFGLNDSDQIVGSSVSLLGYTQGFLRDPVSAVFTVLPSLPGTSYATVPNHISNAGQISVQVQSGPATRPQEGVYDLRTGQFTFYQPPILPGYPYTLAFSIGEINDSGQALVRAGSGSGRIPYLLAYSLDLASGSYNRIDLSITPDASYPTGMTTIVDFNDLGQQIGNFSSPDTGGISEGFLRDPDGSLTTLIDPASTTGTILSKINEAGQIFGEFSDIQGLHFFVANPVVNNVPEPPAFAGVCLGLLFLGLTSVWRASCATPPE